MANFKSLTLHHRNHLVIDAIERNNTDLDATRLARKYGAMSESPYRFFRGTSHLFWDDMFNDWRFALFGGVASTQTWIQGDAHVYNFGTFTNHAGEVVYGLDDFDDAIISDYQYDLWRLAVSLELDTREHDHIDAHGRRKALRTLAKSYIATVLDFEAEDITEEVQYTAKTAGKPLGKFIDKVDDKKGRPKMLKKWTRMQKNGKRVLDTSKSKLKQLSPQDRKAFLDAFEAYRKTRDAQWAEDHFEVKDVARRLKAGTGSLGIPRYYVLIEGPDQGEDDDVILDIKQQDGPAALAAMNDEERKAYRKVFSNEGERHMRAFEAMSEHPDRYLGWLEFGDAVFSVRERNPYKDDFDTSDLKKPKKLKKMAAYWGEILANDHKRGSRSLNSDEPFLFEQSLSTKVQGREEEFIDLIATLARQYADCVTSDYYNFVATLGYREAVER